MRGQHLATSVTIPYGLWKRLFPEGGAAVSIVVIGGGVGGLPSALALTRAGHAVTLLERDRLPDLGDPETAFATERRGAPQVHQTHGFLARFLLVLRDRFPDVHRELLDLGCEPTSL